MEVPMTRYVCPCSAVVEEIDDGKEREFESECPECVASGGNYAKSSHWKEPEPPPPAQATAGADHNVLPFPSTAKNGKKKGKLAGR
ncbi:MAG: hypothetical protein NT034_02585 [Candidatus Magasanikbacteria bacterium]|nr:hypothetical protein [Candidatus Magasanikbacteria bacterium]